MNISKMKRSTQIAIMAGAGSGAVEKIASGTAPLTLSDSVAGSILEITVNGRSEVSAGSIISVGDNGLTVTTANSDNTLTTSAEFTTALPLRGVYDTVRDKLTCTADVKQVETVCGKSKLADLTWDVYNITSTRSSFATISITNAKVVSNQNERPKFLCSSKSPKSYLGTWDAATISQDTSGVIIVTCDPSITTVSDFVVSLGDAELIYELATPVTTPLTSSEIAAFRGLRTYDPTTSISVTDNPSITVTYMGKKTTRTAPKKRTSRKKKA